MSEDNVESTAEKDVSTETEETTVDTSIENSAEESENTQQEVDTAEESQEETDVFNMSDEEFDKLMQTADLPDLSAEPDAEESTEETAEEDTESSEDTDTETSDEVDKSDETEVDSKKEEESESTETLSAEDQLNSILGVKDFNGQSINIGSAEDALELIKLGVTATNRMQSVEPQLKIAKLLENNGLLDAEKVNLLIDASNGNADAIKQLIKVNNIDPLELDMDADTSYQPSDETVSTESLELDRVLQSIQHSPHYQRTTDIIGKQWDGESRAEIVQEPRLIEVINTQIASGVFDIVSTQMNSDKLLGKLKGKSDLAAYVEVFTRLKENNGFSQLENQNKTPAKKALDKLEAADDKKTANKNSEDELAARRKAASVTKSSDSQVETISNISPLEMSEEDFEKFANKYL